MFDFRLEGKSPIYEQLFSAIAGLIGSGSMSPDEKLPAVREVAKQLCVNPNTVQKAYAQLEQAGLIYSIPAKGSYVSPESTAVQALRGCAVKSLETALAAARNAGVPLDEVIQLADEIWNKKVGG